MPNNENFELNSLKTLLNEVGAYIFTKDLEGKYTFANNLVLELFNQPLENVIGKDDSHFFDLNISNSLRENDLRVLKNGEVIEKEERNIIKSSGEVKIYWTVKKPLYDKNGKIKGMCGISTDITESHNLKENLKYAQKIAKLGHYTFNITADIWSSSEVLDEIFGIDKNYKKSFQTWIDLVSDDFKLEMIKYFEEQVLNRCKNFDKEYKIINQKSKESRWVHGFGNLIFDDEGKPIEMFGVIQDITKIKIQDEKIKEKEQILQQKSKMAAMGEMIESIAHQWRQPLSVISTISTGIKLKKELGVFKENDLISELNAINDSAQYLSKTIDYFRGFLKNQINKEEFSLTEIILNAIYLSGIGFIYEDIKIIKNLQDDIKLFGIKNELIQVVVNILNNAKDVLRGQNLKSKVIIIESYKEKNNIILKICDNGEGISERIINKIFEPYFTTKKKKEGSGIGLYMCRNIIEKNMKGIISIQNKELTFEDKIYKGACFEITLPIKS